MKKWEIAVLVSLLLLTACTPLQKSQQQPPNILWIIAEDLSPDLGCYGHPPGSDT